MPTNLLFSQYASGQQFPAGLIAGSKLGLSGLNPIVDRMNLMAPAGSIVNIGSILIPSGTSATLIKASNTNRQSMLITNFGGSDSIFIGDVNVTPTKGYRISANDFYEYRDTEAIYGITLTSGGVAGGGKDIRFLEIQL